MGTEQFPITLDSYYFTRMLVVAIPSYSKGENEDVNALENIINVQKIDEKPGYYQVLMKSRTSSDDKGKVIGNPPYLLDFECFAILRADESLSPQDAERGVAIVGHSVVYGAIRDAVSWMTGSQVYGRVTLPLSVLPSKEQPEEGAEAKR